MRKKYLLPVISVIVVLLAAFVIHRLTDTDQFGPPYSSNSTAADGASLLFDTLHYMGYPVRRSRSPLDLRTNTNHVYIIIQPRNPWVNSDMAEEMLEWVRQGGRLIFLQNGSNIMDSQVGTSGGSFGSLTIHEVGSGILVTGQAIDIANLAMINDHATGAAIERILNTWNADRIMFAEYYHGDREDGNMFSRLPLVVRLVFIQLILLSIAAVWYFSKRFGNAIPYYEETERGENEHLHAVVRLLIKRRK